MCLRIIFLFCFVNTIFRKFIIIFIPHWSISDWWGIFIVENNYILYNTKIYNILNKLSDKRVAPVITMVLYFGIDKETVEVALTCL